MGSIIKNIINKLLEPIKYFEFQKLQNRNLWNHCQSSKEFQKFQTPILYGIAGVYPKFQKFQGKNAALARTRGVYNARAFLHGTIYPLRDIYSSKVKIRERFKNLKFSPFANFSCARALALSGRTAGKVPHGDVAGGAR